MSFDANAFVNERFEDRVTDVPVPDLRQWFETKQRAAYGISKTKGLSDSEAALSAKLVWRVRGLTGDELGRVNEAVEKYKNVNALISSMIGKDPGQKAEAVKEALGIAGQKTPESIVRELELVVIGSVDPVCDMSLAVKLKDNFPIEFRQIAQAILIATGKGRVPGKPQASGETTESEPASACVTSEGDSSMNAGQTSFPVAI